MLPAYYFHLFLVYFTCLLLLLRFCVSSVSVLLAISLLFLFFFLLLPVVVFLLFFTSQSGLWIWLRVIFWPMVWNHTLSIRKAQIKTILKNKLCFYISGCLICPAALSTNKHSQFSHWVNNVGWWPDGHWLLCFRWCVYEEAGGLPKYTVGEGAVSEPPPSLIGVHQVVGLMMNKNDKVQAWLITPLQPTIKVKEKRRHKAESTLPFETFLRNCKRHQKLHATNTHTYTIKLKTVMFYCQSAWCLMFLHLKRKIRKRQRQWVYNLPEFIYIHIYIQI